VQLQRYRELRQVTIAYACVRRVDVPVGEHSVTRPVLISAIQGLVAGSGILLAARLHNHPGVPIEPGRFALSSALPSAAVGALIGVWRQRRVWANAPLPPQVIEALRVSGQQNCVRSAQ
jgi:hypothetical protein